MGRRAGFISAAVDHFAYEADLMRRTSYPDVDEHLGDRRVIAAGLVQVVEAIEAGRSARPLLDEFLTVWLAHHAGGIDLALARHVVQAEVKEFGADG